MSPSILPYLLLVLAYAGLSLAAWRDITHDAETSPRSALSRLALPQALLAATLVWHAILLRETIWVESAVNFNFTNALSAVAWLTAVLFWVARFARPMVNIGAFLLPVAAVCALMPALGEHPHWLRYFDQPWATLHIGVALVAYSFFIVAALQALLLMSLEKRLHGGQPLPVGDSLPPLLTLERFLFRLIVVAFVLLTLTVASGILFSEELFHRPFRVTYKVVFSFLAWGVFAGLLFGRNRYGWRGRTALRWIVTGSAMLLIAYAGSKFVLEVLLGR